MSASALWGVCLAREIDRKLRLTAALLGAVTRKELAAAFRKVNAATPFDVERAHKWLQGRARPREQQVYEDWAKLLDLGRPGQWIAECDSEAFLDEICTRHERDADALRRQVEGAGVLASPQEERGPPLVGTYACYRHALSPYLRGRLVRGELTIATAPAPQRLSATWEETLATGRRLRFAGRVTLKRELYIDVGDIAGDAHTVFCLFPPAPLVSVLAGFMLCAPLLGPEVQPSVTRIAMIRLPAPSPRLRDVPGALAPQELVAGDLASLGMPVAEPALVDQRIAAFLGGGNGGGFDQLDSAAYRALAEVFDSNWLPRASAAEPASAPGSNESSRGPNLISRRRQRVVPSTSSGR